MVKGGSRENREVNKRDRVKKEVKKHSQLQRLLQVPALIPALHR